jgi:hypothetical protein
MTNDPQWPSNEEPPEQGRQQQPNAGQGPQSGQEPGSRGRGRQQPAGGQRDQGGSYQQQQPQQARQEPYRTTQPEHGSHAVGREPEHHSHLGRYLALGVIGLLALGGLIGGLVASLGSTPTAVHHYHAPSPHVTPTHAPTTHVPTHASASPSASSSAMIKQFQYVGPRVSGGFVVPAAVTTNYIYKCPKGPGPFDAKMMNASGSDTQTIASTSGPGGTGSVVLHPKHPGSTYHLAVTTKCEYRIQVFK